MIYLGLFDFMMKRMKTVYITGVSGTGKTTLANELEKRGFYTISIDEVDGLCSWVNQETGAKDGGKNTELNIEFVDAHDWVCDIDLLRKLLDKNLEVAFVLGMATNQNDFLHIFDKILLLQCDPEVFCKRIENRTDNDFGKDPKIQKQILARYKPYAEEMIAKGAITINTDRPIHEVVEDVLRKIL